MKQYDCIVIGLGAMGSSTLYHLAKQGLCSNGVLGIEQFKVTHSFGSSHGLSRIIRMSYWEHPAYVQLLRRSYQLWNELEQESGKKLLTKTGSLDIGLADSNVFLGAKYTCEKEGLDHQILNQEELADRFPGWKNLPNKNYSACYQPDGGILHPERCVSAYIAMARKLGAEVNEEETVLEINAISRDQVEVKTNKGTYLSHKVVLSSGPWLRGFIQNSWSLSKSQIFNKLSTLIQPERNVVIWYKSQRPEFYQESNFPVFIIEHEKKMLYGFPMSSDPNNEEYAKSGIKIGLYHHRYENLTHEMLGEKASWRTNFDQTDENVIGESVKTTLNDAYGPVLQQIACIFTNTPDEHFIIDSCPDPEIPCVAIISACSGHGFKFSSVVGEIMATLVNNVIVESPSTQYKHAEIDWLRAKRFFLKTFLCILNLTFLFLSCFENFMNKYTNYN